MNPLTTDVVIAGAGISGLVAAKVLLERDLRFIIIDAADEAGGRLRSETHAGFILDRGFQVLLTGYPQAQKHLDFEQLDLCTFPKGATTYHNGRFTNIQDPRENLAAVTEAFSGVIRPLDLVPLWKLCNPREDTQQSDNTDASSYLSNAGFSDAFANGFLKPFLRGISLDAKLTMPMERVHFYMRTFAEGTTTIPAKGIQQIARQLAGQIPKSQLLLNSRITTIEPGKVHLADGTQIACRAVISALDATGSGKLADQAVEQGFHHTVCHYFSAPEGTFKHSLPLVLNGSGEGPINHLAIPSLVSPTYAPEGRALVGATEIGTQDTNNLGAVREQLESWYGEQATEWIHLKSVAVPNSLPTQSDVVAWQAFAGRVRDALTQDFGGPVAVAGDFSATASLNGAMASGADAAESIYTQLNQQTIEN